MVHPQHLKEADIIYGDILLFIPKCQSGCVCLDIAEEHLSCLFGEEGRREERAEEGKGGGEGRDNNNTVKMQSCKSSNLV